jgi:hypothetical protein
MDIVLAIGAIAGIALLVAMPIEAYQERDWPRSTGKLFLLLLVAHAAGVAFSLAI